MSDAVEMLRAATTVLVVDWPSPDVPDSLARAGFGVFVKNGPGPRDFAVRELEGDRVVVRPADEPPARVDLIYAHRPVEEVSGLVELGRSLEARTLWWQSGLSGPGARDPRGCWVSPAELERVRAAAAGAGLSLVADVYIGDAVRELDRGAQ